jgi:thioesterase domain-containing protein/acyl carrier protein
MITGDHALTASTIAAQLGLANAGAVLTGRELAHLGDDTFARARLPVYMVPTAFLHLDAFPLNTNGKIDRKALPLPDAAAAAAATGTGPRNDAEERIAAIWSEVLGVSPVLVDQDFFALGGTSLKAVEVRARIEKAFARPLPLRALFESPTIENLVGQLGQDTSDEPIVVRLRRGPAELPPLHCLLGIELYQDLARALLADRTVVGIHVPVRYRAGYEQVPGVAELARRYLLPIREFQPHGPYHLLGFCFGGIVAFEVARQLETSGERVATVTVLDSLLPRAYGVSWRGRLAAAASKLGASLGNPRALGQSLAERAKAEIEPLFGRAATRLSPEGEMREVRVDAPDLEAEIRRYAHGMQPLRGGRLLVFQGLGDQWPEWVRLAPGLGWFGLGPLVSLHRVPSSHLALVRPPHSTALARVLAPVLLRTESEAEEA